MPSNALQATITAALAPIVAAVYLLAHVPESSADQSVIVLGAAAAVSVVFGIYSAFAHHTAAKVKVAQIAAETDRLYAPKVTPTTSSGGGFVTTFDAPTPASPKPAARKRPSRARSQASK